MNSKPYTLFFADRAGKKITRETQGQVWSMELWSPLAMTKKQAQAWVAAQFDLGLEQVKAVKHKHGGTMFFKATGPCPLQYEGPQLGAFISGGGKQLAWVNLLAK